VSSQCGQLCMRSTFFHSEQQPDNNRRCSTEFWYMSIIFPCGIAIFQASNIRLMAYATAQRCLIDLHTWSYRRQPFTLRPRGFAKWFRQLDYVTRTYFCIAIGVLVQVCCQARAVFEPANVFSADRHICPVHRLPSFQPYEWMVWRLR